ncbi:tetratricopeptide repeat-containing protein (plasmid) [Rhizobium sp. NXC24]|nr:tetratricopeptide repeat-containing protein [Rhizobium sp. NXC24]
MTELSEQGNVLLEGGDPHGAIKAWRAALELLPEPQTKWEAAMWLYASIGDAQRQANEKAAALQSFQTALACGDGYANPFVLLGFGTCLYDLGRRDESTDPLLRTYMLEGGEIFQDIDPVYLDHLRSKKLID